MNDYEREPNPILDNVRFYNPVSGNGFSFRSYYDTDQPTLLWFEYKTYDYVIGAYDATTSKWLGFVRFKVVEVPDHDRLMRAKLIVQAPFRDFDPAVGRYTHTGSTTTPPPAFLGALNWFLRVAR